TVPNSGTGSSGTNRKTGFVAAMLFCVSNIRHNPIFSLVQGVQLRMTVWVEDGSSCPSLKNVIQSACCILIGLRQWNGFASWVTTGEFYAKDLTPFELMLIKKQDS
ncbi:MAG TPA: hypothetical protein VK589_25960, partial [Chryseolinea sp.]|nr:hypothetical protein [Chryseolinea sp.]